MRAIVQRVTEAHVAIDGLTVGSIQSGFLVYVGIHRQDSEQDVAWMIDRLIGIRLFNDDAGKINLSIRDLDAELEPGMLVISNFTLYGDATKNRRPSFTEAAGFEQGQTLFNALLDGLRESGIYVQTGEFGGDMQVMSTNDGPVNVLIESRPSGP